MLDGMSGCGNVTSSVRAMGIDVGSSNVKAAIVALDGGRVRELAVARRSVTDLDAAGLVATALAVAADALAACAGPVAVIGIASMAEPGALVAASGRPGGPLIRWHRGGAACARLPPSGCLDLVMLHSPPGPPP